MNGTNRLLETEAVTPHRFAGNALGLVVSVIGNLSIAGFFLSPALFASSVALPADYGMIIFAFEFLNFHASAIALGVAERGFSLETSVAFLKKNPKLALVAFYLLAAASMGIALRSWILPGYFALGVIAKFFGQRAGGDDVRRIVLWFLLLLFAFGLGMLLAPLILFCGFILAVGVYGAFFTDRSNLPQPQLFRDRLELAGYAAPLVLFIPVAVWSLAGGGWIAGERLWAVLYFPSLAISDTARFLQAQFVSRKDW